MNGVTSQYTYDQLGRLATLTHTGPSGSLSAQSYSYDAAGNRTGATNSMAQSLATQAVAPTLYDGDNEQVQFGPTVNTFDANGNLMSSSTTDGNAAYTWDTRGRLVSVSAPNGQTTSFGYDFAGNLVQQKDAGPAANVTQVFVLDDFTNVAYVSRSDGDQYSVLAGRWLDDHLAVAHSSGLVEYGLGDSLNSTVVTVDQTGATKGRFFYDSFGQTIASNSTFPFQFTGRTSVSSSLYYNRARFYSPATGRFISEDPIGFVGGDANLYRYARNQPLSLLDSWGLSAEDYVVSITQTPVTTPGLAATPSGWSVSTSHIIDFGIVSSDTAGSDTIGNPPRETTMISREVFQYGTNEKDEVIIGAGVSFPLLVGCGVSTNISQDARGNGNVDLSCNILALNMHLSFENRQPRLCHRTR